eukprot:TRINITY_DN366_c0_g1_i1.p1 TRINITY_DN366_c0_g1~~TRINITY_DN366_c0_g1_i1.p1  ORF type:complete len:339 (-),score=93.48 TRINITY_DN366_c0_g1_i1:89-1084(-)
MKVVLLVALLLVGSVTCFSFSDSEYQTAFTNWMQKYQKVYAADEFKTRFEIFKASMDFVQQWNMDDTHSHSVELNLFADLTTEEYKNTYLMTTKLDISDLPAPKPFVQAPNVSVPFGDVINWAANGAVTPPKNQGQCGSCWSFSTTGAVEGLNQIYTGNLISLSEQNLIDCSGNYGTQGCNGAWPYEAMQYIIANNGIDTESSYPYTAAQGSCQFNSANTGASMKNYQQLNQGDEGDLQNNILKQPVSVCIDASHQSFQLYSSGIYSESACSTSNLDHAVLAIGYGSNNGDYYIVKNSWGTGWGMGGYIWMARNDNNMCGIATAAVVPLAQ